MAATGDIEHPLLTVPENDKDVLIVLVASDRGLCGSFNNQLFKHTATEVERLKAEGKTIRLIIYGKKGAAFFKDNSHVEVVAAHTDNTPTAFASLTGDLSEDLVIRLSKEEFGTAYLAYNAFVSTMTQRPTFEQLLPMKVEADDGAAPADYIFEPEGQQILDGLLPLALRTRLFQSFLDTEAGEQAARMQAMDNATRNAGELIDKLTLQYNRARQAAITKELIEIISGADAL